MSLAWATVVVAVLLTPGAFFFAGLYAPQAVSRETVAISPMGQLASIVCISFFLHGIFYLLINYVLAGRVPWVVPVDLAKFFPVLHADADPTKDGMAAAAGLESHVLHVLVYFALAEASGWFIGLIIGLSIEYQLPLFSRLARHPWLYEIRGPMKYRFKFRGLKTQGTVVQVSALSKVQQDGQIILYEGQLAHVYMKVDGAISYMTLVSARSRILALPTRSPAIPSDKNLDGTPFTPGVISSGQEWALQQNPNMHKSIHHKSDMLFLAGSEVSNFYFERRIWGDQPTSNNRKKLLEKYRAKYKKSSVAETDQATAPSADGKS